MKNKYPLGFPKDDLMVVVEASSQERAKKIFRKSFMGLKPEMVTKTGDALAARIERSYKPYNVNVSAIHKGVRSND